MSDKKKERDELSELFATVVNDLPGGYPDQPPTQAEEPQAQAQPAQPSVVDKVMDYGKKYWKDRYDRLAGGGSEAWTEAAIDVGGRALFPGPVNPVRMAVESYREYGDGKKGGEELGGMVEGVKEIYKRLAPSERTKKAALVGLVNPIALGAAGASLYDDYASDPEKSKLVKSLAAETARGAVEGIGKTLVTAGPTGDRPSSMLDVLPPSAGVLAKVGTGVGKVAKAASSVGKGVQNFGRAGRLMAETGEAFKGIKTARRTLQAAEHPVKMARIARQTTQQALDASKALRRLKPKHQKAFREAWDARTPSELATNLAEFKVMISKAGANPTEMASINRLIDMTKHAENDVARAKGMRAMRDFMDDPDKVAIEGNRAADKLAQRELAAQEQANVFDIGKAKGDLEVAKRAHGSAAQEVQDIAETTGGKVHGALSNTTGGILTRDNLGEAAQRAATGGGGMRQAVGNIGVLVAAKIGSATLSNHRLMSSVERLGARIAKTPGHRLSERLAPLAERGSMTDVAKQGFVRKLAEDGTIEEMIQEMDDAELLELMRSLEDDIS